MTRRIRPVLACLAALLAAACGGGSKSSNADQSSGPVLTLSATSVTFPATQAGGALPAAKTVSIGNSGGGTLATPTATPADGWLDATVVTSGAGYALSLRPNTSALTVATHTTTVRVASAGAAGSPRTVDVSWPITAAATPVLAPVPTTLEFSAQVGSGDPATRQIVVYNGGAGSLGTVGVSSADAWLSPTIVGTTVTVAASLGNLTIGDHTGHVTLTAPAASNSPYSVPVTFHVTAAPPVISTGGVTSLSFTTTSGTNPASRQIAITNGGGGTLAAVTATPSYTSGAGWMSAAVTGSGNGQTVTVSIAAPATAGTYSGSLSIASAGATNSPVSIAVTLQVNASGGSVADGLTAMYDAIFARAVACRLMSAADSQWVQAYVAEMTARSASAVSAGRMSYSQQQADACATEVNSQTCAQFDYGTWSGSGTSACATVLAGAVANGSSCLESQECANGYCRYAASCPGTCTTYKGLGESCGWSAGTCGPGLVCPPGSGTTCVAATAPGSAGQPCSNTSPPCTIGNYCSNGTCAARVAVGGACAGDSYAYNQCVMGALCVGGFCRAAAIAGESCVVSSSSTNCLSGTYCSSTSQTCAPDPVLGQDCTQPGHCADDSVCSGTSSRTCVARPTVGQDCTAIGVCEWGIACVGDTTRTCVAVPSAGQDCTAVGYCSDASFCTGGTSKTCVYLAVGQDCSALGSGTGNGYCSDGSYCIGTTTKTCTLGTAAVGATCSPIGYAGPTSDPATLCNERYSDGTTMQARRYCGYDAQSSSYTCQLEIYACY